MAILSVGGSPSCWPGRCSATRRRRRSSWRSSTRTTAAARAARGRGARPRFQVDRSRRAVDGRARSAVPTAGSAPGPATAVTARPEPDRSSRARGHLATTDPPPCRARGRAAGGRRRSPAALRRQEQPAIAPGGADGTAASISPTTPAAAGVQEAQRRPEPGGHGQPTRARSPSTPTPATPPQPDHDQPAAGQQRPQRAGAAHVPGQGLPRRPGLPVAEGLPAGATQRQHRLGQGSRRHLRPQPVPARGRSGRVHPQGVQGRPPGREHHDRRGPGQHPDAGRPLLHDRADQDPEPERRLRALRLRPVGLLRHARPRSTAARASSASTAPTSPSHRHPGQPRLHPHEQRRHHPPGPRCCRSAPPSRSTPDPPALALVRSL